TADGDVQRTARDLAIGDRRRTERGPGNRVRPAASRCAGGRLVRLPLLELADGCYPAIGLIERQAPPHGDVLGARQQVYFLLRRCLLLRVRFGSLGSAGPAGVGSQR